MKTSETKQKDAKVFAAAPLCVSRFDNETGVVGIVSIGQDVQAYEIDGASAFIWRQLDGRKSVEDIYKQVLNEFEVSPTVAKRDLHRFLDQLLQLELIQERDSDSPKA